MFVRFLVVAIVAGAVPVQSQQAPESRGTPQKAEAPEPAPPVRLQLKDPSVTGGTATERAAALSLLRARVALEAAVGRVRCPTVLVRPDPAVEHAVREVKPDERVDHKIRRLAPTVCVE